MVTTIQLNENVKNALARMKQSPRESFEDVLVRLIRLSESLNKEKEKLLIEGYKEMAEETLKITKEFEVIEDLSEWEWNDEDF
jgi:predicted CopG family antitoxin